MKICVIFTYVNVHTPLPRNYIQLVPSGGVYVKLVLVVVSTREIAHVLFYVNH